jgi:hypothetical protein
VVQGTRSWNFCKTPERAPRPTNHAGGRAIRSKTSRHAISPDVESRRRSRRRQQEDIVMGRGILLWLLGVPIPIIILLALFSHH